MLLSLSGSWGIIPITMLTYPGRTAGKLLYWSNRSGSGACAQTFGLRLEAEYRFALRCRCQELVVSTLGVLYTNDADADVVSLAERIPITPLAAFSYMLFVLIYFPCIATLVAIKQESGSWKWAIFTAGYTTALAWLVSFAVYQIGGMFL